jgi:hypothetical protein
MKFKLEKVVRLLCLLAYACNILVDILNAVLCMCSKSCDYKHVCAHELTTFSFLGASLRDVKRSRIGRVE